MYPCDICHMNSERIRDKWLILSHMSKGSLKSTKGDKKGINEKEKRTSSLHFLAWYPAVRGENIFERERVQLLSRFPDVRTVSSRRSKMRS